MFYLNYNIEIHLKETPVCAIQKQVEYRRNIKQSAGKARPCRTTGAVHNGALYPGVV